MDWKDVDVCSVVDDIEEEEKGLEDEKWICIYTHR